MLILFALGSLLGAAVLNFFSILPDIASVLCWGISGLCLLIPITLLANKLWFKRICVFLLASIVGFSLAYQQARSRLQWSLPSIWWGQAVAVKGNVSGISQWHQQALRFDLVVDVLAGEVVAAKPKIRLFWPQATEWLQEGDEVTAMVKLQPPWHLANPGGFDQQKQFFIEEVRATGKIIAIQALHLKKQSSVASIRQKLNQEMAELLEGKPLLGVIQATTLGLYKNITPRQWQVFQYTGTTHAIAISGLHISLVAMLFGGAVTFAVRKISFLMLHYPARFYGAIAAMLSATLYCTLAGFSIPTQRSLAMILVALFALLTRQKVLSWDLLALAWLGIGIVDPLATLQMGFWLSFGCVAALIYGGTQPESKRWQTWVMPQCVVFIGLLPMGVQFFHQAALLAPLANIIALPIINFLVIPPSLLAIVLMKISTPLATLALNIAHSALSFIWVILEKLANCSWGMWYAGEIPLWICFIATLSVMILLAPKGLPGKPLGWFGLLPLFCYQVPLIPEGEFRLAVLDVGQGLATVIKTRHHVLLYDVGPSYGNDNNAGSRVIKPYLRSQQIKKIDTIMVSHGDLDHRGGLQGVIDLLHGEIISSEPERLAYPARHCFAPERWEWDGVQFQILSPSQVSQKKRNDRSCVLKVTTQKQSVLLTGDIEKSAEQQLIKENAGSLSSSIVIVPHHGSLTSSSFEFIEHVAAEYAVFPVGFGNHYGFPKAEILARYQSNGAKNLIVAQSGAVIFQLNNQDELTPPTCWRDTSLQYWHTMVPSGE